MSDAKKRTVLTCLSLVIFVFLLYFSSNVSGVVLQSVTEIFNTLLPSLFPFLLFGAILTELSIGVPIPNSIDRFMNRLFHLPGDALGIWLVGMLCGFPSGALAALRAQEAGVLTRKEAGKILFFVNSPSPAFCISLVGRHLMGSPPIGCVIYISTILGSLITALIVCRRLAPGADLGVKRQLPQPQNLGDCIINATLRAIKAFALLCSLFLGVRVFWMLPQFFLTKVGVPPVIGVFLYGLIDAAGGCVAAQQTGALCGLFSAFFLAFQGLLVFLQTLKAHRTLKTDYRLFFLARFLNATFSCLLVHIFIKFLADL